jgi:hypothetical protein
MGEHQYLENGHVLVTEAEGGRVFEIDGQGGIVWEYVSRFDDERVFLIGGATRYPDGYFPVSDWGRCDDASDPK